MAAGSSHWWARREKQRAATQQRLREAEPLSHALRIGPHRFLRRASQPYAREQRSQSANGAPFIRPKKRSVSSPLRLS
jgi:hypothetical protein